MNTEVESYEIQNEDLCSIAKKATNTERIENGFTFNLAGVIGKLTLKPNFEVYHGNIILTCDCSLYIDGVIYYGYTHGRSHNQILGKDFAAFYTKLEKAVNTNRDTKRLAITNLITSLKSAR